MPLTAGDLKEIQDIVSESLVGFEKRFLESMNDAVEKKLEPFRREMDAFKLETQQTISELKVRVDDQQKEIEDQRRELVTQQHGLNTHQKQIDDHIHQLVLERIKLLDLEIHHRKYNMLATNLEESQTETNSQLIEKFRRVLTDVVKLPNDLVKNITFKAAHRLGRKQAGSDRPRTAIFVFEKLDDITEAWGKIRKLGRSPYNFKTHLPSELSQYRTDRLIERDSLKKSRGAVIRVAEEKGYPYMDEKINGTWIRQKHFKDQFAHHLA